jgi:hypothetical protein
MLLLNVLGVDGEEEHLAKFLGGGVTESTRDELIAGERANGGGGGGFLQR